VGIEKIKVAPQLTRITRRRPSQWTTALFYCSFIKYGVTTIMLDLDFIRSHPDIIHQFNEVEQCVISKADHEDSVRWHEQLIRNTEELVQALELPNRVVNVCTGDMGDGKVGMYDLEC